MLLSNDEGLAMTVVMTVETVFMKCISIVIVLGRDFAAKKLTSCLGEDIRKPFLPF